tara:strand:- start:401 stop:2098 length:1698 start_codon:yes stop_codon:yes gene_type:complete
MVISSATEVLSLAAVLPFLLVLANPNSLWERPLIQQISLSIGINNSEQLLLPITIIFASFSILSGIVRVFNLWLNGQVAAIICADLSFEVYRKTLFQPYTTHLNRSTSYMLAVITNDVGRLSSLITSLLLLISSSITILSLMVTLIAINWVTSISAGLIITITYLITLKINNKSLIRNGIIQQNLSRSLIKSMQEGLGAIRDVLLDSSQAFYLKLYTSSDRPMRRVSAQSDFLTSYPKLVLEPLGMVIIASIGFILAKRGGITEALPMIGALALGAQKLLPLAQKVYEGLAGISSAKESMGIVLFLLDQKIPDSHILNRAEAYNWEEKISFKDVSFKYSENESSVLENLNLIIHKGERIGLIGSTGSGKSTTLDLLIGLLMPTTGNIFIDNESLHNLKKPRLLSSWRALIAHVPQNIFLADCSIAENIAFGISKDLIDIDQVKKAAKKAQISSYIESTPNKYDTFVGEQGIRLSGGQRQRIGIARALYKDAKLLVFDEATSALDNNTEKAIMDSIESLDRDITILIIAHRLTTVERCDRVIYIKNGKVEKDGPPEKILKNISFKK